MEKVPNTALIDTDIQCYKKLLDFAQYLTCRGESTDQPDTPVYQWSYFNGLPNFVKNTELLLPLSFSKVF
jgi:hypothetical protein